MAGFLTGPAAHLVGAGMQAIGVGIPVGQTGAKLINGMRDVGIPVPPKSWFKRKDSKADDPEIVGSNIKASKSPKKNVYDKLEEHIQGVIQVVRPVIELKQMVREGCCKSADRAKRADRSPSPSKERLKYYTPQKCSSGNCEFEKRRESASPSKKRKSGSKKSAPRRKDSTDDDDADEVDGVIAAASRKSCMYCSRSKRLLELPCGGLICSKCDETEDHEQESKMPRRTRNLRNSKDDRATELIIPDVIEPVDVIDLTQDSPMNTALRLSRARAGHEPEEIAIEQDHSEGDSVILTDESDSAPMAKKPKLKPAVIINLDETISLDDNLNNTPNQNAVSPRKPGLNCPICLENLADENIKAMSTPCGHVYCLECLKKVTTEKKKCSLCQRPISFAKCIRLHI